MLSPFERAVGEQIGRVEAITVEVERSSKDGIVGHGSGILVSPDGDVLTAAHVVKEKSLDYDVVFADGQRRSATVARVDMVHDAALLRAPGDPTAFARPAVQAPKAGQWAVCSGYGGQVPGERRAMASAGVIVDPSFSWEVTEFKEVDGAGWRRARFPGKTTTYWPTLLLDCSTAPGMSGGPVVDLDGALLGMVVGADGIAASIEALRPLLPKVAGAPAPPREPTASDAASVIGRKDQRPTFAPGRARTDSGLARGGALARRAQDFRLVP